LELLARTCPEEYAKKSAFFELEKKAVEEIVNEDESSNQRTFKDS
jgi:hypothetical protein